MDHPQVLEGYKPRVGHQRRAPAALCLDEELEESCPSGSCQDLWPVQGTAADMEEEVFTPAPAQDTQKLWKMLESDQFQSIWWSECGKCVAINKDLFKVEVLGRGVRQRVFNTRHIKSVIRQLNLYGFTKVQRDIQRSASLPEFLSEEAAASAHSQILYYYNPSFNRAHPWLLGTCKRRAALKQRALGAAGLDERPL
ncbi:heat shock transcription factor, Y-linked-like isoform 2-T2 [Cyanocitta cristata]